MKDEQSQQIGSTVQRNSAASVGSRLTTQKRSSEEASERVSKNKDIHIHLVKSQTRTSHQLNKASVSSHMRQNSQPNSPRKFTNRESSNEAISAVFSPETKEMFFIDNLERQQYDDSSQFSRTQH